MPRWSPFNTPLTRGEFSALKVFCAGIRDYEGQLARSGARVSPPTAIVLAREDLRDAVTYSYSSGAVILPLGILRDHTQGRFQFGYKGRRYLGDRALYMAAVEEMRHRYQLTTHPNRKAFLDNAQHYQKFWEAGEDAYESQLMERDAKEEAIRFSQRYGPALRSMSAAAR